MSRAANLAGFSTSISPPTNLNIGIVTATSAIVGTAVTINSSGINVTGVLTATSFSGSGASLTGIAATANVRTDSLVVSGITTVAAGSTAAPSITPSGDSNTGIFFPSADTIAFGEGGAESMRIDSSSRLLLGTSSATSNFFNGSTSTQVQIGGSASASLTQGANDVYGSFCIFAKSRSSGNTLVQSGDQLGLVSFQGNDGSEHVEAATIQAVVDGTPGANDMPGRLIFSTTADGAVAPTEQARITSAGDFRFNSGYGSAATAYGCRAWVNFNGTGTVAIRASGNVSSITDNGTGDYTVNFTTAMVDANYSAVCSGRGSDDNRCTGLTSGRAQTTSSVSVYMVYIGADNSYQDGQVMSVAIFR